MTKAKRFVFGLLDMIDTYEKIVEKAISLHGNNLKKIQNGSCSLPMVFY
jgi:hypothetical protein